MGEFFHSWQRKAASVTLMMALALTGMWNRSDRVRDTLQVRIADQRAYLFVSGQGAIIWQCVNDSRATQIYLRRFCVWSDSFSELKRYTTGSRTPDFSESISVRKIVSSNIDQDAISIEPVSAWTIPYWPLAISMELLTAILILWPVTRKPPAPNPV